MSMWRDKNIVPALMFHSTGMEDLPWVWSHISEPYRLFEKKLQLISSTYHTIFWADLYQYMQGKIQLPPNSILLTFDDGYLDNWCYVFPLLQKYGLKATIFVSPDFVDRGASARPQYEAPVKVEQVAGFLNWQEMKLMEQSGLVDIQSHALTHTWYFTSPNVVDFYSDGKLFYYPWLAWNESPESKPEYLTAPVYGLLHPGHPIFQYEKSLVARRFFPDSKLMRHYSGFLEDNTARVKSGTNLRVIYEEFLRLRGLNCFSGTYETEEARMRRVIYELAESKRLIEKNLSKEVDYICWPGGGNDESVVEAAKAVGYKSYTMGSQDSSRFRNRKGSNPGKIKRLGSIHRVKRGDRYLFEESATLLNLKIKAHQGSLASRVFYKAYLECKSLYVK